MMDAMAAKLSNILPYNWKEDLDELCKEVVLSTGEDWQHKFQHEMDDLKTEFQIGMKFKGSSYRTSPIFNPLFRNEDESIRDFNIQ